MEMITISVDEDAYDILCRARHFPDEPFSAVIKRGQWTARTKTCGELLEGLRGVPFTDEETIRRLEEAQRMDAPPDDPWEGYQPQQS